MTLGHRSKRCSQCGIIALQSKVGLETVSHPTKHGHPEVKLDVVVECSVTSGMILAEWAKSGVYFG